MDPSSFPKPDSTFRTGKMVPWRNKLILVDWDRIRRLDFECRPEEFCTPATSCCKNYEVTVGQRERKMIYGMLPFAAEYVPDLKRGGGFEDPFEYAEPGLSAIEQDEDGACRFAYQRRGALCCALHQAALDAHMDPVQVKPRACVLWPLALGPGDGYWILSVDPSAESFACVKLRRHPRRQPGTFVIDTLLSLFGACFLLKLLPSSGRTPK